jgi:hypothetical protein
VIGGDTLGARKPDPLGLRVIARRWGTEPERILLVGDSAVDASTAGAAGTPLVLVAWGFGRVEELRMVARAPSHGPSRRAAGGDRMPGVGGRPTAARAAPANRPWASTYRERRTHVGASSAGRPAVVRHRAR